jgi:hypothetical protein
VPKLAVTLASSQRRLLICFSLEDATGQHGVIRDGVGEKTNGVCLISVHHFAKVKQDTVSVLGDFSINDRNLRSDQWPLLTENTDFLSEILHCQLPSKSFLTIC